MPYYNKVILMGNLCKDPESRQTPNNVMICNFTLAVSRKYVSNGQEHEEVCFVDITAFNAVAGICSQFLRKGSPVMIDGRLQLDQWEDRQTGEKRSKLKVLAENVQLLGRKEDDGNRNNNGYQQQQPQQQSQPRRVDPQYAPPPIPEDDSMEIPF